jgi:peptidoglycan/LPS O-acetylase OafA/YrhL
VRPTTERYELLDGLRGEAAFAVLAHHMLRHLPGSPFAQAYLAVDFFFLLSGFVIGAAYERRLTTTLSFRSYARIRLIRLYPMVLLGAALGAGVVLVEGSEYNLGWLLLLELLFVPFMGNPAAVYTLNSVQWSLLFEFFANFLHAAFCRALSTGVLVAVVVLSGAGLIACDFFFGSLGVGWSRETFGGGFFRVAFSFAFGLLLFRLKAARGLPRAPLAWLLVPIGLGAALAAPRIPTLPDTVFVMVFFPALLALGAGAALPKRLRGLAIWAGAVSYPLYAIHVPLLGAADLILPADATLPVRAALSLTTGLLIVLIAWGVERFYDRPIRERAFASRTKGLPRNAAPAPLK